ncbi:MAG: Rrf2 family transcriptional regulator, partial [Desulfofustis sp.]|nr:Rrf2 family transcriptional regulator [Desulfofustis sp.]
YAKQNLRTSGRDLRVAEVSRNSFEQVALALLVTLAERFSKGSPPLSHEQLSALLFIPPRLCRSILSLLQSIGFVSVHCSRTGHCRYQLGRSAENLSLAEIIKQLRDRGEEVLHLYPHPQTLVALETCRKLELLVADGLQGTTLKDLVVSSQEQGQAEPVLSINDGDKKRSQPG